MTKKLVAFTLILLFASITANADWLSRYWDGCKPSCSWTGKPTASGMGLCKECNKQDQLITPTSDGNRSACDGGTAYTCWDMSPVAASATLAYGFVASNPSKMSCGSCYELTFTGQGEHGTGPSHQALNGKKMIVMASNIGGDVHNDQFDLLVPGGGVGQFDAFSNQINKNKSDLGSQYGGLLAECPNNNNASVAENQSCLKTKCAQVFAGQAKLKAGCDFYADWLMGANNPKFTSKSITCPQYLIDAYKGAAGNPPGGGVSSSSSVITPTTYTLTVNRNPAGGGTTTPTPTQSNITAGTPVNITATPGSNYTFQNWTGSQNFGNAYSATTTVTLYANTTITANFTLKPTQPTTYTLTVSHQNGGTTTPASTQTVNSGAATNITATASSGYTFQSWVVVTGTATFANANSATTTVTLSSNATIRANFTQNSGGGSSSSSGNPQPPDGTGNCIDPPGNVAPPNGIETCIKVNNKCYICNQERGQLCSSEWLWTGQQVDQDWWFTQVSCPGAGPSSSSSKPASSSSGGVVPVLPQAVYGNVAHIQANGIYLQVMNNAKFELFDLRGNSVKKINFSNGIHSVQLNDLPKGLYLAKISFGSERKILRVPLR